MLMYCFKDNVIAYSKVLSETLSTQYKTVRSFNRTVFVFSVLCSLLLMTPFSYGQALSQQIPSPQIVSELIESKSPLKGNAVDWQQVELEGEGKPVYFHAWGGDPQINRYIQWLATEVNAQYNIDLHHVKLTDTSEAVSRVLAEKAANNLTQGQVDLVWINGENFASMSKYDLLIKGWANQLPNFALTNPKENPAMTRDFGLPTQGMEAPWGQASLAFFYAPQNERNSQNPSTTSYRNDIAQAPKTIQQLLVWAKQNPGRFSYPKPPDFLSLSFLKYALITLNSKQPNKIQAKLYQTASLQSEAELLPQLWQFLDELHPVLWRKGRYFVASGVAMQKLMSDGETHLGFSFSIAQIPSAVDTYRLPKNTRSYVMQDGSLSNIHFIAIPFNAANRNAAKLVANAMLSVVAQAKKQQSQVWGDSTVIDIGMLPSEQRSLFNTNQQHPSALPVGTKIKAISELHPSWSKVLTREWLKRYGAQ